MYEIYLIVQLCICSRVHLVLNPLAYENQHENFLIDFLI